MEERVGRVEWAEDDTRFPGLGLPHVLGELEDVEFRTACCGVLCRYR